MYVSKQFSVLIVSRECTFLGSLSRHNKDLERRTLALGSWTNRVIALRQISVTALFYLEDSRRVRERERASVWLLLLYVFSSTWACPMQIGLSQECCLFCLFCLKSSLWSSDLPCLLATAILDSLSLFYLPNNSKRKMFCSIS